MTDYKELLEWLMLPLRPKLRAERRERKRRLTLRAIAEARRELAKLPAKIRPKYEAPPIPKFKRSKKRGKASK